MMVFAGPANCHSRRRDATSVTTGTESVCRRLNFACTEWIPFPRIAIGDARRGRHMGEGGS